MRTHIQSLIQTDIQLSRLAYKFDEIGFSTDAFGTNHVSAILYFMGIESSDKLLDAYYKMIDLGNDDQLPENDQQLSEQIFDYLSQQIS